MGEWQHLESHLTTGQESVDAETSGGGTGYLCQSHSLFPIDTITEGARGTFQWRNLTSATLSQLRKGTACALQRMPSRRTPLVVLLTKAYNLKLIMRKTKNTIKPKVKNSLQNKESGLFKNGNVMNTRQRWDYLRHTFQPSDGNSQVCRLQTVLTLLINRSEDPYFQLKSGQNLVKPLETIQRTCKLALSGVKHAVKLQNRLITPSLRKHTHQSVLNGFISHEVLEQAKPNDGESHHFRFSGEGRGEWNWERAAGILLRCSTPPSPPNSHHAQKHSKWVTARRKHNTFRVTTQSGILLIISKQRRAFQNVT